MIIPTIYIYIYIYKEIDSIRFHYIVEISLSYVHSIAMFYQPMLQPSSNRAVPLSRTLNAESSNTKDSKVVPNKKHHLGGVKPSISGYL